MDFLTTAIYTVGDDGEEKLSGAVLTRFDPEDLKGRPKTHYVSAEELRSGEGISPEGFIVDDKGILLSDTTTPRVVFQEAVSEYIGSEFVKSDESKPGLIDFILECIETGSYIITNFSDMDDCDSDSNSVIPASSLKVSNSSFNIYAIYKKGEAGFRTLSLVDIESEMDDTLPFYVKEGDGKINIERYGDCIKRVKDDVYRVELPLLPSYTFMGEAFINYLTYSAAYYRVGLGVIEHIMSSGKYVDTEAPKVDGPREDTARERKIPAHNVAFISDVKSHCVHAVLDLLDNPNELVAYINRSVEADVTYKWIKEIMETARETPGTDYGESINAACLKLRYWCTRQLRKFELELLSQRLYVHRMGFLEDQLPITLKGGGVNGTAIKKATW